MFLTRLVYTSTVAEGFNPDAIEQILESARKYNGKNNVTGMLLFNRKYFLQCLEGTRTQVNRTYRDILNDPRHKDIIILDYSEIVARAFSRWAMGYVPETQLTKPLNLKYSGAGEFNPYQMSGESAHEYLIELSEILETV
jgi:hypothetical protein